MPRCVPTEGDLVSHLHRAALDRAGWQDFVLALEHKLSGAKASLHGATELSNAPFLSVSGSFDQTFKKAYLEHYHRINPFMPLSAALPSGKARLSPTDLPEEILKRTEFYNDWLRPQDDLSIAVAIKLRPYHSKSLILSLNIRERDGENAALRAQLLLDRLEPHLSHAFHVAETISDLSFQVGQGDDDSGGSGGLLMLDDSMSLIWAEPRVLMQEGEVFWLNTLNKIVFQDTVVQDWVRAVSKPSDKAKCPPFTIQTINGWQIRLVSAKIASGVPSPFFGGNSFAKSWSLFLLSRLKKSTPSKTFLQVRFALTPTEAEIAIAIAKGLSTAEIATSRQVSVHTVRNQVRSVLDKMEARHRIDVTRILTSMTSLKMLDKKLI